MDCRYFISIFNYRRANGFQTSGADPGFKKKEFNGILPQKILKFEALGNAISTILRQSHCLLISHVLKIIVLPFYFLSSLEFNIVGFNCNCFIQTWSGQSLNITMNKVGAFSAKFWIFYSGSTIALAKSEGHRILTHPWQTTWLVWNKRWPLIEIKTLVTLSTIYRSCI